MSAELCTEVVHLEQVNFTVVVKTFDHKCDFEVFEIFSREPLLWSLPTGIRPDPTCELTEAERFLHGSIKWDGCSDWHFDIQDDCMMHFCDVQEAESLGQLLRLLYEIAADSIPCWDSKK
jgi:hypothetical protein